MQPRCEQNKYLYRIKNQATPAHAQGWIFVLVAISNLVHLAKMLSVMDHH